MTTIQSMIRDYGDCCKQQGWIERFTETTKIDTARDEALVLLLKYKQEAAELLEQIERKVSRRDVDS